MTPKTEKDLKCPRCKRNDLIRKVSAVVNSDTTFSLFSGNGSSYEHGHYVDYNMKISGQSQSQLAELLMPPIEPFPQRARGCVSIIVDFLILSVPFILLITLSNLINAINLLCTILDSILILFAIATPIVGIIFYEKSLTKKQRYLDYIVTTQVP